MNLEIEGESKKKSTLTFRLERACGSDVLVLARDDKGLDQAVCLFQADADYIYIPENSHYQKVKFNARVLE